MKTLLLLCMAAVGVVAMCSAFQRSLREPLAVGTYNVPQVQRTVTVSGSWKVAHGTWEVNYRMPGNARLGTRIALLHYRLASGESLRVWQRTDTDDISLRPFPPELRLK